MVSERRRDSVSSILTSYVDYLFTDHRRPVINNRDKINASGGYQHESQQELCHGVHDVTFRDVNTVRRLPRRAYLLIDIVYILQSLDIKAALMVTSSVRAGHVLTTLIHDNLR
jgi:hypothetical protein